MFIVIRKYKVQRGTGPMLTERVRDGFLPLLRERPGFRGYHLLESGPDVLVSITMYDNANEALASSEIAASWVRDNILEVTRGMPEVMVGHALVTEVKA